MENIYILTEILGWGYFLAWSFSFYGQLLLNFRIKSVEGMNLSYLYLNITGFVFYSIYCLYGYFNRDSPEIDHVNLHDLLFALHALMICSIKFVQTLLYPRGKNKLDPTVKFILVVVCLFSMVYAFFTKTICIYNPPPRLSIFNIFGYLKLLNTFVKYLPQMIWNFKRKSTSGFSICGVFMDATGAVLLLTQMHLQYYYLNYRINPVKVLLASITIFYNLVFFTQRFYLYVESSNHFHLIKDLKDDIHMDKQQFYTSESLHNN